MVSFILNVSVAVADNGSGISAVAEVRVTPA